MLLWAAGATIVSLVLICTFHAYRRQIRNICRQMAFLREQKTNLLLGSELPFSELNELTDRINECVTQARETGRAAEKSSKSLKEAIAGLSHDIRTPLTSLDGYFQLLEGSYDSEEPGPAGDSGYNDPIRADRDTGHVSPTGQRQHYISVIRSRISSLEDMLEELFTFTQLTDESYVLETERMDFKKSVYDMIFAFYDSFNEKKIVPEIRFCDEYLPIMANEEAVHRILQNMIKNVLVHGDSAVRFTLRREEDGSQAVFACENQVKNPEEIDVTRVFERFYKNDSARTHTSTGLGLSIAKELAERMGGRMEAEVADGWFVVRVMFIMNPATALNR